MKRFLVIVMAFSVLISCKNDDASPSGDEQALYSNTNKIISSNISDFILQSEKLVEKSETFKNTYSQDSYDELTIEWINTIAIWSELEMYNILSIQDAFIHNKIAKYPINSNFLEGYIEDTVIINEAFVASKGSTAKGLHAIEYFLFEEDQMDSLETNLRRREYVLSTAQNINSLAHQVQTYWANDSSFFVNNEGKGLKGSLSVLTNAINAITAELALSKIGNPETLTSTSLPSHRSQMSSLVFEHNLISIKEVFEGIKTTDNYAFYNYLDDINAKYGDILMSTAIKEQITTIEALYKQLDDTLESSLDSKSAAQQQLYEAALQLAVMCSNDMSSQLNVITTVSDNDGD